MGHSKNWILKYFWGTPPQKKKTILGECDFNYTKRVIKTPKKLWGSNFFNVLAYRVCVGGGRPPTIGDQCLFKGKLKVFVFENGLFGGHLIFDKNNFIFGEKKTLIFPFGGKNAFFGNFGRLVTIANANLCRTSLRWGRGACAVKDILRYLIFLLTLEYLTVK